RSTTTGKVIAPTPSASSSHSGRALKSSGPSRNDADCCRRFRPGLAGMLAQNHLRVAHADAVGGMRLEDVHAAVIGLGARPVALPLEHHLQRGHRYDAGLDRPLNRPLMRLDLDLAARGRRYTDIIALRDCLDVGEADAKLGPEPSDNELLASVSGDGGDEPLILPGIHRGAVEGNLVWKYSLDFRQQCAAEGLRRDGGQ